MVNSKCAKSIIKQSALVYYQQGHNYPPNEFNEQRASATRVPCC